MSYAPNTRARTPATIAQARTLCETAAAKFNVAMGRVHERPVGPHPDWSCQLAFKPVQQALQLPPTHIANEGMQFVHHHGFDCPKQATHLTAPAKHERFQRLGRDQHHPARVGKKPFPAGLPHIPVPWVDRNIHALTQQLQALHLVIDECFDRCDIKNQAA